MKPMSRKKFQGAPADTSGMRADEKRGKKQDQRSQTRHNKRDILCKQAG